MSTENQFVVRDFLGLGNLESHKHQEGIGSSGARDEGCEGKLVSPVDTGMKQVPISEMQSRANNDQSSGLCNQTNWNGSSSTNNGTQPHEDCSTPAFLGKNFVGTMPKEMIALPLSTTNEQLPSLATLRAQLFATGTSRIPKLASSMPLYSSNMACPVLGVQARAQTRMLTSDPQRKHSSAQLTIFYNGSVNVYNDIPAEKAQTIMLMASSGCPLPSFDAGAAQSRPAAQAMSGGGILNIQNTAEQAVQISPSVKQQPEFAKSTTPCVPSSPLPTGQPVVPRALPQARKASLARFLEKRKERVQSKCPYVLMKTEQSGLPGFLSLNHNTSAVPCDKSMDKRSMPISFGMEEMPDPVSVCDSLSATGS